MLIGTFTYGTYVRGLHISLSVFDIKTESTVMQLYETVLNLQIYSHAIICADFE